MNEQEVEEEDRAKSLNAPRLTPEHIDSVIVDECFWQPSGTNLTICVLLLKNKAAIVGESACVSPENFDAELGKKQARDNARRKVFELEGYLLRERIHANA